MTAHSYGDTLKHRGLQPFLWTQFLGAFNDNLFKIVVSMLAVHAATQANAGRQLSLVGLVFILPFLLFSGYAGQLADVHSKRTVLVVTKSRPNLPIASRAPDQSSYTRKQSRTGMAAAASVSRPLKTWSL